MNRYIARRSSTAPIVLATMVIFCTSDTAIAQLLNIECESFSRKSGNTPAPVQAYFSTSAALSVRRCHALGSIVPSVTSESNFRYSAIYRTHQTGGVCHFDVDSLAVEGAGHAGKLRTRTNLGRSAGMYVTKGACPGDQDDRYVSTTDTSPKAFLLLMSFVATAISTESTFNQGFADALSNANEVIATREVRAYVQAMHQGQLRIRRVARAVSFGLWEKYEITVASVTEPLKPFELVVTTWFGRPMHIVSVGRSIV